MGRQTSLILRMERLTSIRLWRSSEAMVANGRTEAACGVCSEW